MTGKELAAWKAAWSSSMGEGSDEDVVCSTCAETEDRATALARIAELDAMAEDGMAELERGRARIAELEAEVRRLRAAIEAAVMDRDVDLWTALDGEAHPPGTASGSPRRKPGEE